MFQAVRTNVMFLMISCVFSFVLCLPIFAAEIEWRVGIASVDITPTKPMLMRGYANRTQPHQSVGTPLNAKALAIEDAQGRRRVIITADFIGFTESISAAICQQITKATGVPRDSILLNASHTHNGPMVARNIDSTITQELKNDVIAYTREFEQKIATVAIKALNNMQPASLSFGRGVFNAVINRREFTESGIKLGANPSGLADRSVPILRVTNMNDQIIAVLFGAAAHNTTIKDERLQINGDYAGYAQSHLQSKLPGAQAMFMLGCAGDIAPYPLGTVQIAKEHGHLLAEEVLRVMSDKMKPVHGPLQTALMRVDLPLQPTNPKKELEQIAKSGPSYQKFYASGALALLKEGKLPPKAYNAPFAAWRFGDSLTLIGFSGETCVGYVELTERAIGHRNLWIAAYCNDTYGYLPTAQMITEGGYETRGLYTSIGLFTAETQNVVIQTVKKLAQQVGRGFED